jgi:hypothetical protein
MSLLTDLFDAQLAVLESDVAKDLLPTIQKSVNSIAANPTVLNVLAQADLIAVSARAELPKVAQDEIQSLATWVNNKLQQLAAKAPTVAPPAQS